MVEPTTTANPGRIVDIATAFMGSKHLFAASRIGIFRALADGPLSLPELAARTGRNEHQVRILADSMLSLGLLARSSSGYRLENDAETYLSGHGEVDLAPFLAFLNDISYPQWLGYDHTVDSDEAGTLNLDSDGWSQFLAGVMNYNDLHAIELAQHFDFGLFRSAIDVAGISPTFAIRAMKQNPLLRVEFIVDKDTVTAVEEATRNASVTDRTIISNLNPASESLSQGHDLVMVNHVLHRHGPDENSAILTQARAAAKNNASLIVLDFFLDDSGEQRRLDALHAGEYYNIDGTMVYPVGVVSDWLTKAGWKVTGQIDLPGSPRVILATAA